MVLRAEADPLDQGSVPQRVRHAWRHGEGSWDAGGDPEQYCLLTMVTCCGPTFAITGVLPLSCSQTRTLLVPFPFRGDRRHSFGSSQVLLGCLLYYRSTGRLRQAPLSVDPVFRTIKVS